MELAPRIGNEWMQAIYKEGEQLGYKFKFQQNGNGPRAHYVTLRGHPPSSSWRPGG
jgi:hypothetical protein